MNTQYLSPPNIVNCTKDMRNKLDSVKHVLGEEMTAAIVNALKNSPPGDAWASVLEMMIEAIPDSEDGKATGDEAIGLANLIKGFAESHFEDEQRLKTPLGARSEMYFRTAQKMYDAANRREEVQMQNRMHKDKLTAHLAAKCGISRDAAGAVLRELAQAAVKETNTCNVFNVPGVGKIVKEFREPMTGQNPQTGEPIVIPSKTTVRFHLDNSVRMLCGGDDFQRDPTAQTNSESGSPGSPLPGEGVIAMTDNLDGRLEIIRRLIGEETTEAFVEVMKNSAAGDRLADVLQMLVTDISRNEVLSLIVTNLADPALDARNASEDELMRFARNVGEFVKARRRLELSYRVISITPRTNASVEAVEKLRGDVTETESTVPDGRMDKLALLAYLAARCEIPPEAADAALRELAELVIKETNAYNVFEIPGIGVIARFFREERVGRNPYTGKPEFLPARTAVKFRLDQNFRSMCGDDVARADQQT